MRIKPLTWKQYIRLARIARVESTVDWRIHVTQYGDLISYNQESYRHHEFWETRDAVVEDLENASNRGSDRKGKSVCNRSTRGAKVRR